ncbi:hypothetical protein ANN_22436 [Periplaneta americana]|uniref:Uncharacterized protein n=1 Tax=Periplaneta americana TaxID=6978 RepID=A0ABQ8S852_PERAM|nr:hypothetical protein ANN_22436 [Periplaneta americana]
MKIDTSPKCDSNIKVVQTTNENPGTSTVGSNSDPSNGSDINKVSFADVVKGRKMKTGMNNSSCLDVYGINSKILKIASVYIIEPLAHIFNCCIDSGVFPDSFKFVKAEAWSLLMITLQGFQFPCFSIHPRESFKFHRSSKYNIKNENSVAGAVMVQRNGFRLFSVVSELEHALRNAALRARNNCTSEQLGVGTVLFRNSRFRSTVHFSNNSDTGTVPK